MSRFRQEIEIEREKGASLKHVVRGEEHLLADLFPHPITAVVFDEELAQPLRRDVRLDHRRVKPIARIGDRLLVDIGRENLHARRMLQPVAMFAEQHRDRVGFLARRAAGHPDADFVVLFLAREKLRDVRLERREGVAVAEEMRHADEQILEQRARFRRMGAEEIRGTAGSTRASSPACAARSGAGWSRACNG